jgi:hypothetical protein
MPTMTHCRLIVLGLALLGCSATDATAQAWLPPKGEGAVSVLYQNLFTRDHFLAGGGRVDRGQIQSHNLLVDMTYGLTDRMALTMAAPFIRSRYSGSAPHPRAQDNGETHSAFQNLRFGLRYNLVDTDAVTITPFVGTNVPTHNYEYFAHAAYGTRVRELDVGAYVARTLGPALPNAFVQARYAYSFAERIEDIHHDRSNLDLEVGYLLTPTVRVFVVGAGQKTHGGIDTPDAGWRAMPANLAEHHDRVARLDMLDFGGGIQVSLTRSVEVFGSFTTTTAGRNSHALARGITMGASWSFGRGVPGLAAAVSKEREPKKILLKCLCQK